MPRSRIYVVIDGCEVVGYAKSNVEASDYLSTHEGEARPVSRVMSGAKARTAQIKHQRKQRRAKGKCFFCDKKARPNRTTCEEHRWKSHT